MKAASHFADVSARYYPNLKYLLLYTTAYHYSSTYPTPMTCPISCRTTPSKMFRFSIWAMSAMSNVIAPARLMVLQSLQILDGPAEPRIPPKPSISSSVELIRSLPGGFASFPPHGTWVITSDHLHRKLCVVMRASTAMQHRTPRGI